MKALQKSKLGVPMLGSCGTATSAARHVVEEGEMPQVEEGHVAHVERARRGDWDVDY